MAIIVYPTADANSYVAVADADTYFADRLGATAWTGATTANKEAALITATRMIDRQRWQGEKTDPAQDLEWPRTGVLDKYGEEVADDALPDALVLGVYELALALLENEALQDSANTGSNVKRVKAGPAEVEFFRPTVDFATRFSAVVSELIGQFLLGATTIGAFASGTDRCSYFDDDNNTYELNDWIP